MDSFVPDIDGLSELVETVFLGGPVARYGVLALLRNAQVTEDIEHVTGDIYLSNDPAVLARVLTEDNARERIRLYAGHAGWAPGQLEFEIARGSWKVLPVDENIVFSKDPSNVWQKLSPKAGAIIVRNNIRDKRTVALNRRSDRFYPATCPGLIPDSAHHGYGARARK